MEIQNMARYAVFGALAAVAYLIILQWNEDYGSTGQSASVSKNEDIFVNNIINNEVNVGQQENLQQTNSNIDDIPVVEDTKKVALEEIEEGNLNQYVRITTDVLDIVIDSVGGDIVQVKLPQHHQEKEENPVPLTLLQRDQFRFYIAQSGLVGANGPDGNKKGRPTYKSEKTHYILEEGSQEISVPLMFMDEKGVEYIKRFNFKKSDYLIDVNYEINNLSDNPWSGNLFGQIKRDNTIDPLADTSLFAMKPFLGFAYWSEEKNYNKINIDDVAEEKIDLKHEGGWISFVQHYFISAWIAPENKTNKFSSRTNSKGQNIFGFTSEAFNVGAGETGSINYQFYAGPKDQTRLEKVSQGLELTVDYGFLWMIAQIIFFWLIKIQSVVGNWGWSIVLLTVSVKILFYPLNSYSFRSMANMRKLQPEMMRMKELYGDDKQKLSQATMEMYRKEKINPLGSCLPILVQMPVFISLYWVLSESYEIRHAPFMGWITDLSVMDPYFVLPILMTASMVAQQKLSPMVFQDPMQEKIMKFMPVMFGVFFLFFPAGLVLYWLVNNILTIAQQWFINKSIEAS